MFYFILGLIVGFLPYANSKGWLVTPAIFIVKTVKGWFGAKETPK